jgi:glycosyltransferase involved in cell wall biosynthesis
MQAPVSVIIPCYCCTKTIGRAVQSIARQSLPPVEVILVNDASPDCTLEELFALQKKYGKDFIKVVNLRQNVGPGEARNQGKAIASQPYIAFLDADDGWHPEKLNIQYSWMKDHPDVSLSGHPILVKKPESVPSYTPISEPVQTHLVSRTELLISCKVLTSSWLFKASDVQDYTEITRHSEDYLLILKTLFDNRKIVFLDAPLAYFFKPEFAKEGMSGDLWAMEKAQLKAYQIIWRSRYISTIELYFYWIWSMIKYLRRVVIFWLRTSKLIH